MSAGGLGGCKPSKKTFKLLCRRIIPDLAQIIASFCCPFEAWILSVFANSKRLNVHHHQSPKLWLAAITRPILNKRLLVVGDSRGRCTVAQARPIPTHFYNKRRKRQKITNNSITLASDQWPRFGRYLGQPLKVKPNGDGKLYRSYTKMEFSLLDTPNWQKRLKVPKQYQQVQQMITHHNELLMGLLRLQWSREETQIRSKLAKLFTLKTLLVFLIQPGLRIRKFRITRNLYHDIVCDWMYKHNGSVSSSSVKDGIIQGGGCESSADDSDDSDDSSDSSD